MNILVSGGSKNGKSLYAQKAAREMSEQLDVPLYYIATMIPRDGEDEVRIKRHIEERRGWGFTTLEQGTEITGLLHRDDVEKNGVFLLDSVTALLSNEMFREDGSVDEEAGARVASDLEEFAAKTGNTVFVSDYIYGDAEDYNELTEHYRRSLAGADRALAACCDTVMEISFGTEERWK